MNEDYNYNPAQGVQGEASGGWGFLGFCFPVVGLIIYLSTKNNHPSMSHKAGKGALIGVIVVAALYTLLFVLGFMSSFA